jgi:TetR/AcrR family transcriptional repressor of nem operon
VIERRLANLRDMLESLAEERRSPAERIRAFAHILVRNRAKIMAYGCPVGTLCSELAKLDHVARDEAAKQFELFRVWLAREFAALGRAAEADGLALHLLMRTQGVATLAVALRDEVFLDREVADLDAWIDAQNRPGAPSHAR